MKLSDIATIVERSEDFDRKCFGIGDESVVISILRSKLYSNAIKSSTQEVMSNARDANREIGNENKPILVTIPNLLEPTFKVRDFGPGITPERMEKVFLLYGNFTKREDNYQTGGFGIGAKSPWAYTSAFSIRTWTPEGSKMIERDYVAIIDETQKGELNLVNKQISDGPQGTEISFAADPSDIQEFRKWIIYTTLNWKVRPIIKGYADFSWPKEEPFIEGSNWCIMSRDYSGSYYSIKEIQAIIDGIPYPINYNNLKIDYNQKILHEMKYYPIKIYFDTGELSITANREEIDYNEKTISLIVKRLEDIIAEIKDKLSQKISSANNLWEANVLFSEAKNNMSSLAKEAEWCGHKVYGYLEGITNIKGCEIHHYTRTNNSPNGRLFRKNKHYGTVFTTKDSKLAIHDDDTINPSSLKIQTLFAENKNIVSFFILCLPREKQNRDEAQKKLKEQEIDLYDVIYLSKTTKSKIQRKNPTARNSAVTLSKVYKFYNNKGNDMVWTSEDKDLTNDDGVYVIVKDKEAYLDYDTPNQKKIENSTLSFMKKKLNVPIYGISCRYKNKIGPKWINLKIKTVEVFEDMIKRIQDNNIVIDINKNHNNLNYEITKNLMQNSFNISIHNIIERAIESNDLRITKNSVAYKYYIYSKNINDTIDFSNQVEEILKIIPSSYKKKWEDFVNNYNSKSDLSKEISNLRELFLKKYSILSFSPYYFYGTEKDKEYENSVIDYIYTVDSSIKNDSEEEYYSIQGRL